MYDDQDYKDWNYSYLTTHYYAKKGFLISFYLTYVTVNGSVRAWDLTVISNCWVEQSLTNIPESSSCNLMVGYPVGGLLWFEIFTFWSSRWCFWRAKDIIGFDVLFSLMSWSAWVFDWECRCPYQGSSTSTRYQRRWWWFYLKWCLCSWIEIS